MAAYLDLEVQRNGMFGRTLSFTDSEGDPLDVSGAVFDLGIKSAAGSTEPRIASATITPVDPVLGIVRVAIDGADFGAVPGAMEIVLLAYDLIATQDDERMVLVRGTLILIPGVS